ncbi:IS66 family transposase [Planctomycetota bacterium]
MGNRVKRHVKRKRIRKSNYTLLQVKTRNESPQPADDASEPREVNINQLKAIIERSGKSPLNEQDRQLLLSVSETLGFLTEQLEKKSISIGRLRKLLFGAGTEKLDTVSADDTKQNDSEANASDRSQETDSQTKKSDVGHGRNGADAYTGAQKIHITHETLQNGDCCPECSCGTLYAMSQPGHVVRVTGQSPLQATAYEIHKLRCGLCGKVYTPAAAQDLGPEKYDAAAVAMIALLKYGSGVPFHRLERLQRTLGVPLAASTQWETLSRQEKVFDRVYRTFIRQAAQGRLLHNDDTTMRILNCEDVKAPADASRKGVFTSGIVSVAGDHQIALFFTGHQHAGENLADILKHRAVALDSPIQMADGLTRNIPKAFETLLANCLAHGRRKFVDIYTAFPNECHCVLEPLSQVYHHDTVAAQEGLSDSARLAYHQQHSGPVMAALKDWMSHQLDERRVEPNSGLGEAIRYMLKHWEPLTLFLHHPGVPLDNNLCERALKKVILHRKNAYFYKTAHGAQVGDIFMSLIHTCELNNVNPFDYLTELQKNLDSVMANPHAWMPWNYQETNNQIDTGTNR